MQKLKIQNGITLIALVVTIVVLLILAGITIGLVFGSNGIIKKAQEANENTKIAQVREQLELAKGPEYIEGNGKYDPDSYFQRIEDEGIIENKDKDKEEIEDGKYKVITVPGYIFIITLIPSKDNVEDIQIDYVGKIEGPRIREINITNKTTNSISIEVDTVNAKGATYRYYYKKEGEEEWTKAGEGKENTYTFNGLEENKVYNIKVEVEKDGKVTEEETSSMTGEMPKGAVQFSPVEWENGQASTVITTSEEGYTLQYQIGGIAEESWKNTTSGSTIGDLEDGTTVYGRLYDGTNGSKTANIDVEDKINPTVVVTEGTITTKSIVVNVEAVDNESGMKETPTYTYYIKKTGEADSAYQAKATEIESASYTFTGLAQKTAYDIKVEVNGDKASNVGEGKLLNKETEEIGGATGGLIEGNIIASSPTWSNGQASITLSTSTGLTIQWQKNGIEGSWTTGTSVTGLNHNDTVYARLTDGVNYGDYASVIIQDKIAPNVPTITLSGTAGNNGYYKSNVTVKITAGSDGQSGANKVRYKVTGAQTVLQTDTAAGTVSASITISTNGTSTITAYTIDKAGNISSEKTQVVYKDSTAPTATLTVGAKTENSIAVSVSASDGQSGLATSGTYKYYINNALKSTSTSNNYTFTGLTAGTSYTLKVIVADKAGNTIEKSATASTNVSYPLASSILKEGDYVIYPEGNKFCMVLYGHSKVVEDAPLSTYGVQLITVGTVTDNFTLGGNDSSTAINSYNNAISTLNNAANQYNNSLYSTARCVGSDPSNPNSESNYGSYYGHLMKKEDSNYITDVRQMEYLGILNIGQKYWLASRYVYSNSGDCDFALYVAGYTTNTQTSSLFYYREKYGSSQAYVATNAFRPVFTLNSTVKVTGGNGSAGAPYTLGI